MNLGTILALSGGLLLWGAFLSLALIARRYEGVFGKPTGWKALAASPSGLLLYSVLVVAGPGGETGQGLRILSYLILLISGLLCAWSARTFGRFLSSLGGRS